MIIEKNGHEIHSVEEWFDLAPPKKGREQWVDGRSAKEFARSWFPDQSGPVCPPELAALLDSHADTRGAILRTATPEHVVRFDALRGEPRNSDMVVLADHPAGGLAISIEAKADEPFDKLVRDVLRNAVDKIAGDEPTNAVIRVQQLSQSLFPTWIENVSHLGDLRYQLLTAVAGAIAFAVQKKAKRAVFLIHEFVTNRTKDRKHEDNATDLSAFVARLTLGRTRMLEPGRLIGPLTVPGSPLFRTALPLYLGKAVRKIRDA